MAKISVPISNTVIVIKSLAVILIKIFYFDKIKTYYVYKRKKIMQFYFLTAKSKSYKKHLITNINKTQKSLKKLLVF